MKKRTRSIKKEFDFGTEQEWIQDLQDLFDHQDAPDTDGFMSASELVEKLGKGKDRVLQTLKKFQQEGRLEIKYRPGFNLAGRRQHIPVYKVLKKPSS